MSTDDLTARVRDHLAHADTLPHGLAISLVSELADEVDRLRAYIDTQPYHSDLAQVEAERDAARAALERVKDELIKHGKHIPDPQDEHLASADYWRGARDAVEHIQAGVHFALEGKPS